VNQEESQDDVEYVGDEGTRAEKYMTDTSLHAHFITHVANATHTTLSLHILQRDHHYVLD